ncbi:MAG TPA: polysaccharide deacetylase family protein [Terriglobales bacterium]|nr:polysaccharide deacetylase family protein [Terriglobales bacterium]
MNTKARNNGNNNQLGKPQTDASAHSFVTISIDDGDVTDLRTAELLNKYGLQATFYIPARNPERPVMPANQVRGLSASFEVGAHTLNHAPLKSLPDSQAWTEISEGKQWLEDTIGKSVISFCYPRGKFNASTPALVKKAGFLGGRTCLFNLHAFPRNPFLWGVSTHAYSHSKVMQLRHAVLEGNFAGILNFVRTYNGSTDWQQHFLCGLNHVEQHGGIAHLYLHSWEIEELGQWQQLETVFQMISQHQNISKVTNGTLFQLWRMRNDYGRN